MRTKFHVVAKIQLITDVKNSANHRCEPTITKLLSYPDDCEFFKKSVSPREGKVVSKDVWVSGVVALTPGQSVRQKLH